MPLRNRTTALSLSLLIALPLAAFGAWTPSDRDQDRFHDAVDDAVTEIAVWTTGDNKDDVGRTTGRVLKAADADLDDAGDRFGDDPEWEDVVRALEELEDAVRLLRIARRAERRNSDFKDVMVDLRKDLYRQSRNLMLSAVMYVMENHYDSKGAAKRLLRAAVKAARAQQYATDRGRYYKGIKLNAKAIQKLANGDLL
jgi:hypothetical protein